MWGFGGFGVWETGRVFVGSAVPGPEPNKT